MLLAALVKNYTARQAILLALVANALRPLRNRVTVIPAFFAGWLTGELAPHILVVQAADTVNALRRRRASLLGLALGALSAAGLTVLTRRSHAVAAQIDDMLRELEVPDDTDPKTRLAVYARPFKMSDRGVQVERNVPYTEGGRRARLDIYRPATGTIEKAPVLIQIHGGGWTIGHKAQQGLLIMNRMAARGWVCVAANYRLAPRHRWPTQIIDVKRAIAWVRENIAEYGGDPDYPVITGGSAGGHLSALAALTPGEKAWQPGFEDSDTSLAAAVPFYGVYDFTGDETYSRIMREQFLATIVFPHGATPDDFKTASPTHRIAEEVPEFLVVHGANDTLARVEQARAFVEQLRERHPGHVTYLELPGTQHAFDVFGSVRAHHTIRGVQRWLEWHRAAWLSSRE
ncbi:MAG TPA: alpha/beta hydrolase [Aeromicrobium sp.]|nr:alpha/beta hydrolase [Aeromicrobium sp.]